MPALLYGLIYVCLAGSLAACLARAHHYAHAPLHLRWELYPVPHEDARRAAHGGSRFEETDWWTKESRPNRRGDLQVMAAEIFLFRGLWKFNRKLWLWSYAFHLGLYLAVCAAFCAAMAALFGPMETVLSLTFDITGVAGCALVIGGASGLMARRLMDPGLSAQTTPADIFNLGFFMATAAMLLWTKATWQCVAGTEIAKGLLTFNTTLHIPAQQTIALAMTSLLILYIPLTHMAHFIAKYFTYHSVRWDDRRNGPAIEAKIAEYLTYKPTWSAAHVGASDGATWADVVMKDPGKGAMK